MTREKWAEIKRTPGWSPETQTEVTEYVDELRSELTKSNRMLKSLLNLVQGVQEPDGLLLYVREHGIEEFRADWGPAADTVEKRAAIMLRTFISPGRDITDEIL